MKFVAATSVITVLLAAGAAIAQPAGTPPPAPSGAAKKLSTQSTPIEILAADARAREILEKHLPGLIANQFYLQFEATSWCRSRPSAWAMSPTRN